MPPAFFAMVFSVIAESMSPAKSGMEVLGRTTILRGFSPFNFKYAPSGRGRSLRRLAKTQFAAEFFAHSENGANVASKIENVCGFFKIQPSISAWLEAPKKSMNKIASDAFKLKVSIWFSEYVFTSKKPLKNIGKDGQINSGRNIVFMPDFFRKRLKKYTPVVLMEPLPMENIPGTGVG